MDKHSGYGRGTRKPDEKKGGVGRGNWGEKPDRAHKRGHLDEGLPDATIPTKLGSTTEATADEPPKVEENKEAEEVTEEIILGVDLDDFLATRQTREKAKARDAEGLKGVNVQQSDKQKGEKAATL